MKHVIHTIPVKMTNCYLIRGDDGWALLESGAWGINPGHGKPFPAEKYSPV